MLAFLLPLAIQAKFDFFSFAPYEKSVPQPESILGYKIGEKTTNFRDQERTILAMAHAAGNQVKVIEYGKSWEGRPLRILAISSPANMSHLDEIRKRNLERSEGNAVSMNDPAIVWVNECIHGDETASFESAMPLVYNLTASRSPQITKLLKDAIVIVNPVYNPDGHERYTVYYNSIAVGSSAPGAFENQEPSTVYGRTNHYRFDMNRDRVAMSQKETREEVAEFLKWHPQVYIDQHGQVATYFFPPNSMSQNENVDRERVNRWTDIFGRATGQAFDQRGWNYFIKDTFDLYYPGYLDSFTTLSGAIGMTQETDGGRVLKSQRADGSTLTLRDGVAHHFTAALAVIGAAVEHRDDLLSSFVQYRKPTAGQGAYVVTGDVRALKRLKDQLASAGIQSEITEVDVEVGNAKVQGPSLISKVSQAQSNLLKSLFETQSNFEPEFIKNQLGKKRSAPEGEDYPGPDGADFYDITGWSIPLAQNLKLYTGEVKKGAGRASERLNSPSKVGFVIEYTDQEDLLCVAELQQKGIKVSLLTKDIAVKGGEFAHGSFVILASRNTENYSAIVESSAKKHGCRLSSLDSGYPESGSQGPGSESVVALRKPKIGIVFGNGANMAQVGGIWYTMEQVFHLPFVPLSTQALSRSLDEYTCIVVPEGAGVTANAKLKEWVQSGGCVVALGGMNWAEGLNGFVSLSKVEGDHQDLPGAIFKAQLDMRSFLSYGYSSPELPVPVFGSDFYKARKEGGSVVRFNDDDKVKKLLSGWEWPDDTEKALAGSVWLQDMPVGRGHAILFTVDPTDRAMWPGLHKLLLNAMLLGPSM